MAAHLVLLGLLQLLAVEPYPAEVGQEVVVRASAAGAPLVGITIVAVLPDGATSPLGITGATGELRFRPERAGDHRFVAEVRGLQLIAPLAVLPARRRWPWALVCVPLGLLLLVRIRRLRA